jgi:4-nitrophenyl phosphatase
MTVALGSPGSLAHLRGFVFDLDGCVWNGSVLEPGAREALLQLHASGRALGFLSNNSRATGEDLRRRLFGHGIAVAEHVVTPLEIIGEFIAERFGRSRVLVMGARELAEAVARGGHALVDFDSAREATVVVVGNDFDVSYARLAAAARAAAAGAPLVTPNLDPRLPVEGGDFLPGCAAFVEAVAVAAGVRPIVVGKPDPPLFHVTMRRMGVAPGLTAMVGDTPAADMTGGRAAGMRTILYAPRGHDRPTDAEVVVRSFAELLVLAGVAPADRGGVR